MVKEAGPAGYSAVSAWASPQHAAQETVLSGVLTLLALVERPAGSYSEVLTLTVISR
jgi:hypothetical protein